MATETSISTHDEDPFPGSASGKTNIFNVKEMFHIIQVIFCLSQKQSNFSVVSINPDDTLKHELLVISYELRLKSY